MNIEAPNAILDKSNELHPAANANSLAMERNFLADERTLMAWIRTSLAMISFGFTIGKLGKVLQEIEFKGILGNTRTLSIQSLAFFLVILGTAALFAASVQHWIRMRRLKDMGCPHEFSITFIVALALASIGGFALTSLVLSL